MSEIAYISIVAIVAIAITAIATHPKEVRKAIQSISHWFRSGKIEDE